MFLLQPGEKRTSKTWQVSYYKAGEGIKTTTFSRYPRAVEFYEEKKAAGRRKLQMQVLISTSQVELVKV